MYKKFYTDSAKAIKNFSNPPIAKPTYNKKNFHDDIAKANLLTEEGIKNYKKTIIAEKKGNVAKIQFPEVDLELHLRVTNELLKSSVAYSVDIPELKSRPDRQDFARQGMKIHEHKPDEICSFCGNYISNERWELLGNYFNDEVKKLEDRITNAILKIEDMINKTKNIEKINKTSFYSRFEEEIDKLNLQIDARKNKYIAFLSSLKDSLVDKNKKLFTKSTLLKITLPNNFSSIEKECESLVDRQNKLSLNLEFEQQQAKDALRYHYVKLLLDEFQHYSKSAKLAYLESKHEKAQEELNSKKDELRIMQDKRKDLLLQTKDEGIIADKINRRLASMGVASFSLELVTDDDENQKGQYQIRSHFGEIRPITHLSKGEKNIIAFLYFIFSLESVENDGKPRIIVLDDPMTSNDDTMQYLMIWEIQKLYRELRNGDYFILLTHNCHFYLNVRQNTNRRYKKDDKTISFYEKYGVFHLLSDGKRTTIRSISKGKQDFNTNYESLWKELEFLYNADASGDLMLNPCRRICETYMNFTKKGVDSFYGEYQSAKKLFDVNLHSIDDFEAEANGKTKNDIIAILRELFNRNNAVEHFNTYWRIDERRTLSS